MSQPPVPPGAWPPAGPSAAPPFHGAPPYGPPSWGPPPWTPPPGPPPRRRRWWVWVAVGAAALVAVGVVVGLAVRPMSGGAVGASCIAGPCGQPGAASGGAVSTGGASAPPRRDPTDPTGLGTEPALDKLARQCHQGVMTACDDLFLQADPDSDYETYGVTCGGRQSSQTGAYCTDAFPD